MFKIKKASFSVTLLSLGGGWFSTNAQATIQQQGDGWIRQKAHAAYTGLKEALGPVYGDFSDFEIWFQTGPGMDQQRMQQMLRSMIVFCADLSLPFMIEKFWKADPIKAYALAGATRAIPLMSGLVNSSDRTDASNKLLYTTTGTLTSCSEEYFVQSIVYMLRGCSWTRLSLCETALKWSLSILGGRVIDKAQEIASEKDSGVIGKIGHIKNKFVKRLVFTAAYDTVLLGGVLCLRKAVDRFFKK